MRFIRTAENLFGLPLGFTRVEYLESSGTQYIDTGVNGNLNTKIEARVYSKKLASDSGYCIAGDFTTSTKAITMPFNFTNDGLYSRFGDKAITGGIQQADGAYTFAIDKVGYYVDGTKIADLNTTTDFTTSGTMMLFGFTGLGRNYFIGKMYYCKIYDRDTLVRDFIPCIDPLGIACMYDLVGKKPYYNAGTGTFTAGRQVIPVNYLESTGTQYIDTGYAFTDGFSWEIDFEGISDGTTLFGGRTSSTRTALLYQRNYGGIDLTTCPIAGYNGQETPFQLTDLRLGRHTIKMAVASNKGSVWVDGTQVYNEQAFTGTYISGTTQALFADKFGTNDYREQTSSKVYGLKMWQGSTLVRDLIPCKDENNVGYMFDTLSGTVYLNAGTGAFSVGENKYTSKLRLIKDAKELPDGYKRVEYLQSDGNQYIDTEYTINTATDEVLFNFQMISTTLYQWIMGEHDNGARFGIGVGDGTNKRNIAYGSTTYKVNDTEMYNNIHYFVANSNGVYLNGTQVHGFESFSSSSTVYLFKLNLSGANGAAGKVWRYIQKRNGVLIRDMIPCLDSNNTPCMFDLVDGKPYYNQGTGDFTYGHIITPVEYLESTGTQYIDTGIKLDNNSSVELDYQLTQAVQNRKGLFGGLDTGGSKRFGALLSPSNNQLEGGYGSGNEFYQLGLPDTNRHVIKQEKNLLYFDGSLVYTFNTATFTQSFNAPLGNFNYTNYNPASAKYYRSKWWDNGTLVRSFIPVRDENNVGYMFDEVTGQLFGNAGSGSFGIGNDLRKPKVRFIRDVIPSAYLPLNYLESTGTQYIDTGIQPTDTYGYRIKNTYTAGAGEQCAIGCMDGGNRFVGIYTSGSASAISGAWGSFVNFLPSYTWTTGTILDVKCNYKNSRKMVIDNTEMKDISDTHISGTISNTLYLFARHYGSTITKMNGKVYGAQITNGQDLVLDLYPVLRKSDNKPGMYDRITRTFFVNQGTGEFNYG